MIAQTDPEDDQQQRAVMVAVASARRSVVDLVVEGVVTAGFARARWPESVPAPDLRLPQATMGPEQCPPTTPAGQESGPLAACGGRELDSRRRTGESGAGSLRWARCPDDGCLHLLQHTAVTAASTTGRAQALCGVALPADSLTLIHGSAGPLCMTCITGITVR